MPGIFLSVSSVSDPPSVRPAAFHMRSLAHLKLSKIDLAIQDYKRAVLVDPGSCRGCLFHDAVNVACSSSFLPFCFSRRGCVLLLVQDCKDNAFSRAGAFAFFSMIHTCAKAHLRYRLQPLLSAMTRTTPACRQLPAVNAEVRNLFRSSLQRQWQQEGEGVLALQAPASLTPPAGDEPWYEWRKI